MPVFLSCHPERSSPRDSTFAPLGAFSSEILTALRAVSPALRLGFDCVPPDTVRCHSELVELLGQRPKSTR